MGRIQTNIGLITGMPIGDTVDQLMKLAARPRDMLVQRTDNLKAEQMAVTALSALLLSVRYVTDSLGKQDLYDQRKITSSNENVLSATLTGNPPIGSYQFTPLRVAQNQQLLSSGFSTDSQPLGAGILTFRFGGHVQQGVELYHLNGGQGVTLGKILITDRSGASAEIDLTTVQTIDDVLEAINNASGISVTAVANGDRIRLLDNTGQTSSNLIVREVGGGTTAGSLGLGGINVAAAVADGQDILWLAEDTELDFLNDGSGVSPSPVLADIRYTLRDGTQGEIDLSPIIPGGSTVDRETTLGELLERINAAEPGKLKVEIAPDAQRLVITDLTQGGGNFQLEPLYDSTALEDLGLHGESVDGVIIGDRIVGGLKTVLLSSLDGGNGLAQLGLLRLTDRSGATDTVDLAGAETLEEVLEIMNAAAVGITARVNAARNGIELVDTTGASAGNLIVANGDQTATAEVLGIAIDADVSSVASGDMHLQVIAHNTRLADLNGGAGVTAARFTIIDSNGERAQVNLADEDIQTVGDVIRQINRLNLGIEAEINETGDGIRIKDLAGGPGTLRVTEAGSSTADLHLLGTAVEVEIDGQPTQVIDGSTTYTVELDENDSLDDLCEKINKLAGGVTATILFDGSSKPYRLSLHSERSGKAGEVVFDTSGIGLSLQEMARAQDALLMLGQPTASGSNVLISSSSNTFTTVLPGATLEIKQASSLPVTISVETTDTNLVANVKTMVENYNQFREKLSELTKYDAQTYTGSVLTGDATALRLDTELSYLLSGRFTGAGSIQSLGELGIELEKDGTLSLDEAQLTAKFQSDPEAVREFFTNQTCGLSDKFHQITEQLAGEYGSLTAERLNALNRRIEQNNAKIESMNARLETQRERLFLQFYRMEAAIGKMQSNLAVLDSIKPLEPLTIRYGE